MDFVEIHRNVNMKSCFLQKAKKKHFNGTIFCKLQTSCLLTLTDMQSPYKTVCRAIKCKSGPSDKWWEDEEYVVDKNDIRLILRSVTTH